MRVEEYYDSKATCLEGGELGTLFGDQERSMDV